MLNNENVKETLRLSCINNVMVNANKESSNIAVIFSLI